MVQQLIDRTDGVSAPDINQSQWSLLKLMDEEGRITPGYAGEEMDVSSSYVSKVLSDLEEMELVRKLHHGLYEIADGGEDA